jgi:hypothetical protein
MLLPSGINNSCCRGMIQNGLLPSLRFLVNHYRRFALSGLSRFGFSCPRCLPVKLYGSLAQALSLISDNTHPSDHERESDEHEYHHDHGDTALLPIWYICCRVHNNTPPRV